MRVLLYIEGTLKVIRQLKACNIYKPLNEALKSAKKLTSIHLVTSSRKRRESEQCERKLFCSRELTQTPTDGRNHATISVYVSSVTPRTSCVYTWVLQVTISNDQ